MCATLPSWLACGKRGDPLPPLRPVPGAITDLAVRRSAARLQLSFTVPPANTDGSTPAAVDRVDVYAHTQPPAAPPMTAAQLVADPANLVTRVLVRPLDAADVPGVSPAVQPPPRPGQVATVLDQTITGREPNGTRYYAVVGVAGTGRGRPGPASAVAAVSLSDLPAAPAGITVTHDETRVLLSWQPATTGQQFRVLRGEQTLDLATAQLLTATPISQTTFEAPVEFGRQVCFSIQAVQVTGSVTAEGVPSPTQCLVPADTYAPATPDGLQVIQDADGITLIWSAVTAGDLAGYVVLRSAPNSEALQPLFTTPLTATTYRDQTTQPGVTYTYAVYAVDKSVPPNVSAPSARQVVTVR
jgi:hypothetical protein